MLATLAFLVTICPLSAMSGDMSRCTTDLAADAPTAGVFYSEVCVSYPAADVTRCEREDFIVSVDVAE